MLNFITTQPALSRKLGFVGKIGMSSIDLQKIYKTIILKELSSELDNLNIMATPRLMKIVVNVGVGKIVNQRRGHSQTPQDSQEMLKDIISNLASITGQQPQIIYANKSIAGFKLREGMATGLRVTLRGKRMYDFLTRLIYITLPRTRDFRGVSLKSLDKEGNLTIGIKESSIFSESQLFNFVWSLEVTLVTSAKTKEAAEKLLRKLGVPLQQVK